MTDYAALVGTELGVGEWVEISQERVDAFAAATNDHQWIHEEGERSRAGPFGGPIVHGFLTLSLLHSLVRPVLEPLEDGVEMIINYGLDRVRFITPVPVGSRVRARVRVVEAKSVAGGVQIKNEVTIELDGSERPAAVVESLLRHMIPEG